ncbi:tetratricopeptide repeat protein [Candidatus Marinimicrobia bacterium MT.SAG.2]|nr:tetratricopeptide repeat protein [Candidatus Marinimicrobia bacterium MT.SAG.2]
MTLRATILTLIIFLTHSLLFAQFDGNNMLFQRARAYHKVGKIEDAIKILEKLHDEKPGNIAYLNLLKESYKDFGDFRQLLSLLQKNSALRPDNWRIEVELIDTNLKLKEKDEAFAIINRLSKEYPNNYSVTRTIALVLSSNRLFDETVALYEDARMRSEKPAPITRDLANFHASRLNYSQATKEYIKFLDFAPQNFEFIRRQLSRFNTDSSTISSVLNNLKAGLKESPGNESLRQLVADYQFRTGNYEEALAEYIILETNSEKEGQFLFGFIENLKLEKQYQIGIKASRKLMTLKPNSRLYPNTYFMLAELTELNEASQNEYYPELTFTLNQSDADRINESPGIPISIAIYDSLSNSYQNSLIASKALFRMGEIYFTRLQNLDEAEKAFKRSILSYRGTQIIEPALARLADIDLERGDLTSARETYLKLVETTKSEDIRLKSKFIISEIEYFSGEFDSSLYHLNDLIFEADFKDPIMNDALELSILLEIVKSDNSADSQEALKLYAKASLMSRQRRYSEARAAYKNLYDEYPDTPLSDDAFYLVGKLSATMGRFEESVETFDLFLVSYPESDLADKVLLSAGEISEIGLQESESSIYYYERLLIDHPRSIYADIARKRLRNLSKIKRVN